MLVHLQAKRHAAHLPKQVRRSAVRGTNLLESRRLVATVEIQPMFVNHARDHPDCQACQLSFTNEQITRQSGHACATTSTLFVRGRYLTAIVSQQCLQRSGSSDREPNSSTQRATGYVISQFLLFGATAINIKPRYNAGREPIPYLDLFFYLLKRPFQMRYLIFQLKVLHLNCSQLRSNHLLSCR